MTFSGVSQGVLEVVGLQPIALPPGPRSVSMHHLISSLVLPDYPHERHEVAKIVDLSMKRLGKISPNRLNQPR